MVQAEEQLRCVVSWYQGWSAQQRLQLVDYLAQQAVPDSVNALLQDVSRLSVSPQYSTLQCQLRLIDTWFYSWDWHERNRLLMLLDIADPNFMSLFNARTKR